MADIWRAPAQPGEEYKGRCDGVAPIARVELRCERELLHVFRAPRLDADGRPVRDKQNAVVLARCDAVEDAFAALDALWGYSTAK
jgi:hypothetical protein